jgi:hypothetical protein
MRDQSSSAPTIRRFGFSLVAAVALASSFSGFAQAQYYLQAPAYAYASDFPTRYNTPAEQHRWYDRGNTDFNS